MFETLSPDRRTGAPGTLLTYVPSKEIKTKGYYDILGRT